MIRGTIPELPRNLHSCGRLNTFIGIQIRAVPAGPDFIRRSAIHKDLFRLHSFRTEELHLLLFAILERDARWMCINVILVKLLGLNRNVGASNDCPLGRRLDGRFRWPVTYVDVEPFYDIVERDLVPALRGGAKEKPSVDRIVNERLATIQKQQAEAVKAVIDSAERKLQEEEAAAAELVASRPGLL